jgi:hypothetical protein
MGGIVESTIYMKFRKNEFVIFRDVELVSALHLPSVWLAGIYRCRAAPLSIVTDCGISHTRRAPAAAVQRDRPKAQSLRARQLGGGGRPDGTHLKVRLPALRQPARFLERLLSTGSGTSPTKNIFLNLARGGLGEFR